MSVQAGEALTLALELPAAGPCGDEVLPDGGIVHQTGCMIADPPPPPPAGCGCHNKPGMD